ncbi:phosphate acyltransferase [Lacticigenium naphthae]|uniref:phosphate acyltransferase n=1 Tax=Lacticigenium naphthae TaxID=515351 RepID=UPI0004087FB0|nr:phosphate acyltransferase [Lacticigenium naphthae]
MAIVAVVGGSRPEILELVRQSKKEFVGTVLFKVFDVLPNIDTEHVWEYIQCESEMEMVHQAVHSVAQGEADILLKGGVQTHTLLKEVLKAEHDLKKQAVLSHVALVNLPVLNRPLLLSDAAMNIDPSEEQLVGIIENAIDVAKQIGLEKPKVALLSAAENSNPKMPSSVMAQSLAETFSERSDALVYGPLSLDLALSKKAVEKKQFEGPIQGDADIVIVPTIDVGNVLYKSFLLFGEGTIGGTIVGTRVPIVLTSRSDEVKSKVYALKFALMQIGEQT